MHGTIVLRVALRTMFKSFKNTYPWCKPYPAKVMSCDIGVFRYLSNKLMQGTQIVGVNSGCEYGLNQVCMPRHRPDLFQLQRINVARIVIKKPSEHLLKRFFVAGAPLRFGKQGSADRKSTRLHYSHVAISYAVFRLKKKILQHQMT